LDHIGRLRDTEAPSMILRSVPFMLSPFLVVLPVFALMFLAVTLVVLILNNQSEYLN